MALNYRETQIVKGMLARGDRQHDIAAYFGVNGGRIAEVSNGTCNYPNADPFPEEKLPPPGPYVTKYALGAVVDVLQEAALALDLATDAGSIEDANAAILLAKEAVETKLNSLTEA